MFFDSDLARADEMPDAVSSWTFAGVAVFGIVRRTIMKSSIVTGTS
jgi:hypothetical protein